MSQSFISEDALRAIVTALIASVLCTGCISFGVQNPFRYDYEMDVTFIVWYGDPNYYLHIQKDTPLVRSMDMNPLYEDYMESQRETLKNNPDALKTINFSFSLDF